MKKIFVLLTATICLLTSTVTYAAKSAPSPDAKTVGIVIIDGFVYKNDDIYKSLKKVFNPEKKLDLVIEAGDVVQSKYMDFWARKGFLSEQPTTEETMIEFAGASGYDKVVYLIVGDFVTNKEFRQTSNPLGKIFPQLDTSSFYYNTTGTVFGFLCDKDKLLNKTEATCNMNYGNYIVFEHCIDKIANTFLTDF